MSPIWFVRMARWVRNPPSPGRVKLVVGVVVLCLALAVVEFWFGWPEALTLERVSGTRPLR